MYLDIYPFSPLHLLSHPLDPGKSGSRWVDPPQNKGRAAGSSEARISEDILFVNISQYCSYLWNCFTIYNLQVIQIKRPAETHEYRRISDLQICLQMNIQYLVYQTLQNTRKEVSSTDKRISSDMCL